MAERDILKSSLQATPQCLTAQQLEALVEGKQAHPHLATCPRCQSELALLKTFESSLPLADEGAAVGWISSHLGRQLENIKHPSRLRSREGALRTSWGWGKFGLSTWRWVVPATALAAVIAVVTVLRTPKEPELQANAGGQSAIYRSQEVQLLAPVGEVQQVPKSLQWQAFPGTAMYKVEVMEVDHTPLWYGQTTETSTEIPTSVRVKMLPGKPILWQVTALDEHSRVLASSQIQRFVSPRENSSEKARSSQ